MTALVEKPQEKEWGQVIMPRLQFERRRDRTYDYKLTVMT
jgi:hypothetical protein